MLQAVMSLRIVSISDYQQIMPDFLENLNFKMNENMNNKL